MLEVSACWISLPVLEWSSLARAFYPKDVCLDISLYVRSTLHIL